MHTENDDRAFVDGAFDPEIRHARIKLYARTRFWQIVGCIVAFLSGLIFYLMERQDQRPHDGSLFMVLMAIIIFIGATQLDTHLKLLKLVERLVSEEPSSADSEDSKEKDES